MKPYILALDLGTTGNRAIIFDKSQRSVAEAYEEFPQIYPKPGWVEHDAEKIWQSVLAVTKRVLKKVPVSRIAALGVTNQRETIVLWDKKTGKAIHNAIVWQDRRTAGFCAALKRRGLENTVRRKTGLVLDPYFSGSKLNWLLSHVKGAKTLLKANRLLAGTIDSWIIWKLSNGSLHVTDTSNASRTLLFDIRAKKWDLNLCRLFGVPAKILAHVVPSSGIAGYTDENILGRAIPIAGIAGDQQAAAFAQGCFKQGVVKNTYGTGLFAVEGTGKQIRTSKNLLTTVAWSLGSIKNTEYAMEGSVFIGGAAIQWLRDGLGVIRHSKDSEKIASAVGSTGDVFFVPALSGLGAPYWDAHARGMIIGITRGTTSAHIVRAALEAIAFQTRDILEVMQKDTRQKLKRLKVDGGAASNDFLMQFQADILGIPVERPKMLETTALGAAGLAGIAVGIWKGREDFTRQKNMDRVFYPKADRDRMNRLYERWKEAVARSRHWAQ